MIKNYLLLFTLISYLASFSQTIVSTDTENKKVILKNLPVYIVRIVLMDMQ